MASETTMQTLYIKGDPQADECCENIPPGVSESAETSKLKVQTESEAILSSTQRCEENPPVSNVCTLLTPLQTRGGYGGKAKSQLSGLSPILESSIIDDECPTPEPLKHGNSPNVSFAFQPMGFSTANRQKSKGALRRLICANDTTPFLLEDECLPEVSMLSLTTLELTTNDSVLSESVPATSKTDNDIKRVGGNDDSPDLPQLVVTTESTDANSKMDENISETKSAPAFMGILETEITLLDVSSNSELSPVGQMSSRDVLPDIFQSGYFKVNSCGGDIVSEPSSSNTILNEDLSKSLQSIKSATENTVGTSLEVTPEVNGTFSPETSGQKMEKSQTSDEDKDGTQPGNITHDISSSSDKSAHISTFGNTSSKKVMSEMPSEPPENTNPMETKDKKNQTCCDTMSTSEASKQSPESAVSGNRTFTQLTSSMNASSGCNTFTPSSCAENKTLDLPPVNSPEARSETESQTKSITTKTSFVVSQDSLSEKESSQRLTFDKYSLQGTSSSSTLGEAAVSFKNKTFDCKSPQKNGTKTFSEISLNDRHHTFDEPPSPKPCNLTTSLKHDDSVDCSSEPSKCEAATASESNDKKVEKHNGTFEANSASERVSGDGGCEMKDLPRSGLPVTDGSSSTTNSQCVDVIDSKTPTFNLDETLDLRADHLITSTPMTNYKMLNFGSDGEMDSNPAAQKKLYIDGPSKPTNEVPSDIPPSITSNRKTLKQPAVKSLLKAAPQLLNKSGFAVPGQLKRVTSGLPLKRSRLQAGAGKTSAASEESQGTVVTSSSYNLRSLTAASKLPSSGLQKQQSHIPFSIPRAASGPGSSAARFGALASSTNKSSGPSAIIPVTKQSLGKKRLHPKGDAFTACKKKKADAAVPASTAKTCDRPSRFGGVKPPGANQRALLANPQLPVCAKCIAFEEELKQKAAKIQRLEKELLKYRKQEDS